jgi:hypothetical protein
MFVAAYDEEKESLSLFRFLHATRLRVQSYTAMVQDANSDGSSLDFRTTAMQNRTTTESNRVIVESLLL